MTSVTTWDEHGRLVSDDGWYVWTGAEWALRSTAAPPPVALATMPPPVATAAMPPPVMPAPMPPPVAPAPMPSGASGSRADVEAEAATYTGTRRLQRGCVRALSAVLTPDETLLATATGTVQRAPGLAALGGFAVAGLAQRMIVVAPTDRRLVLGVAGLTGSQIDVTVSMAYDEITEWTANIGRMGSVLSVAAADGTSMFAFQFTRDKLTRVDEVVAPRLRLG